MCQPCYNIVPLTIAAFLDEFLENGYSFKKNFDPSPALYSLLLVNFKPVELL